MYGNVKSFGLLMQDFYCADQGRNNLSLPLPPEVEGLLSQIQE